MNAALNATTSESLPPVNVQPWRGPCDVSLGLPGSKSLTLRDCAIAALADGTSTIRYPGECDDYFRMRDCLGQLGIAIEDAGADAIRVAGRGGRFAAGRVELFTGQSAVTTRLLMAVAALRQEETALDAHSSMRVRPNAPLARALTDLGATIESETEGYLPLSVRGPAALASRVTLEANVSSQYLTALLIAGPKMPQGLEIEIAGDLVSKPYVELTFDEMRKFGVEVDNDNYQRLRVAPGDYQSGEVSVEGDASAASYWAALATLHGGRVQLSNLGSATRQGDYAFFELCERLGASVTRKAHATEIVGPTGGQLRPLDGPVDMEKMPDVAPTLMVMAPFIEGRTHLTGLATLRVKECDRIAAPAKELTKLGVQLEEGPDFMIVQGLDGAARQRTDPVRIETYHDHRIAMCFGVLGTMRAGLTILDPACVGKTYPAFWRDLSRATPESAAQ